jgi:hypothetical protein
MDAEVAPAGTVIVAGTGKAALVLLNETVNPPVGAGSASRRVPLNARPPATNVSGNVKETGFSRLTVKLVETVAPRVAEMEVVRSVAVEGPVMLNVALVAPAVADVAEGMGMDALLDPSVTLRPPVGIGPEKVTVPTAELPLYTQEGAIEMPVTTGALTLMSADPPVQSNAVAEM